MPKKPAHHFRKSLIQLETTEGAKSEGKKMSEGKISIKKLIPIIVLTWVLSLLTTLVIVYFAPLVPIGTSQIGDSSVTSGKIASGAIITTKLADGSITNAKILDGTIVGEDMADGSIVTIKVANGAITETKIADDSITANKLADASITTTKLADSAIVSVKLADNSVTASKIMNDAIATVKLADGAVTTAKILDGTITAADLADGTVTSVKIADGSITTAKLADFAVTNQKLAPNAIPYAYTSSTTLTTTTSTTFVDMIDTSVTITLTRTSHVLIIFTVAIDINPVTDAVYLTALVGASTALPNSFGYQLIASSGFYETHTCTFYRPSVAAGTYTVKIRWHVIGSATGSALHRTLTVIGLPA